MTIGNEPNPLLSVLMPVYNAEQFVASALDSLLNQNFQNFEIVAINDGSTDLSGKILDEYATNNP